MGLETQDWLLLSTRCWVNAVIFLRASPLARAACRRNGESPAVNDDEGSFFNARARIISTAPPSSASALVAEAASISGTSQPTPYQLEAAFSVLQIWCFCALRERE